MGKQKAATQSAEVRVTLVLVDLNKHPVSGLTVKIVSEVKTDIVITQKDGTAIEWDSAKRGQAIEFLVKKKDGTFKSIGKVTPKKDVNNYTIRSGEFHVKSTTLPEQGATSEVKEYPIIKENEVLTSARLFGDLADYITDVRSVTEVGSIAKDTPTTTIKTSTTNDGKTVETPVIEHHYKIIKSDKPKTVLLNVMGSKLNYPTSMSISEEKFSQLAKELDCELAALKAVAMTESGMMFYIPNGFPKILFERHKFYGFTKPKNPKAPHPYDKFPDICNPERGGFGADGFPQYARLLKAAKLDRDAAICSASWGAFQVLGEYYSDCGFSTPIEMVDACLKSPDGQLQLFVGFVRKVSPGALKALKKKDWVSFTKNYNGAAWKKDNPDYPEKMENYYKQFSENKDKK